MLTAYAIDGRALHRIANPVHVPALRSAVWIDLLDPTADETAMVEDVTGLHVSSKAELQEIESSSRLAFEDDALYLSAPLVTRTDGYDATTSAIGFALSAGSLVTIRFASSRAIDTLADRSAHAEAVAPGPVHVFIALVEALVDRLADVLERINGDLDSISRRIFQGDLGSGRHPHNEDQALRRTLKSIGLAGDLVSRIRESLLGLGRLVPYAEQMAAAWIPAELHPRFATLRQDTASLSDYVAHLSGKVQLLLDATLGFIGISQSNIIKVLTLVSVVGVPPTLIASIYGMNFKNIPELTWAWGYPYGLVVIVLSAILPLVVFKMRGWL